MAISLFVNNGEIIKNDIIIGKNIKNGIDRNLSIYPPIKLIMAVYTSIKQVKIIVIIKKA